jgi:hypothetical protein
MATRRKSVDAVIIGYGRTGAPAPISRVSSPEREVTTRRGEAHSLLDK